MHLVLTEQPEPAAALLPVPPVLGLPGVQQSVVVARLVEVLVVVVRARCREDPYEPGRIRGRVSFEAVFVS